MAKDTKILQSILDGQALIRKDIKDVKEEAKKNRRKINRENRQIGYAVSQP